MRKNIIFLLALALLGLPGMLSAHGGGETDLNASIDALLEEQNVSDPTEIDCTVIDEHALEELGDQVMSLVHPDPDIHEAMDEMMGGEGSESLRLAHINMAKSYLGCFADRSMGYGMMGGPMMGDYFASPDAMPGYGWHHAYASGMGTFGNVVAVSFWIMIVLAIIWLIRELVIKKNRK